MTLPETCSRSRSGARRPPQRARAVSVGAGPRNQNIRAEESLRFFGPSCFWVISIGRQGYQPDQLETQKKGRIVGFHCVEEEAASLCEPAADRGRAALTIRFQISKNGSVRPPP